MVGTTLLLRYKQPAATAHVDCRWDGRCHTSILSRRAGAPQEGSMTETVRLGVIVPSVNIVV
jgi:hypothetical protein